MAGRVWTHPKHIYPAAFGLVFNLLAFVFMAIGLTSCMFTDTRQAIGRCNTVLDNKDVYCDKSMCKFDTSGQKATGQKAGWQDTVKMFCLVAMAIDAMSVAFQLLVFWPLVMTKGVFNIILRLCAFIESIGGFLKIGTSFIVLLVQVNLNQAFSWYKISAIQVLIMPSGWWQFSAIFGFLAVMMLIIATDVGPRGGKSYLELIEDKEKEEQKHQDGLRKISFYKPAPSVPSKKQSTSFSSTSV